MLLKASFISFLFMLANVFSSFIFFSKELNLFFTWLSVLPVIFLAITAHWFPNFYRISNSSKSSFELHGSFLISGFKKFVYLSLHCFPFRLLVPIFLLTSVAISDHYLKPLSSTSWMRSLSSSGVQGIFCGCDLNYDLYLRWH